jgi:purine-binding chemotaxis protein CheW
VSQPSRKLLCFGLGGQELALPIVAVKETVPYRPVTRVFLTPPLVAGLINLRGEVVAVLDLKQLLGLGDAEAAGRGQIIILRARGNKAACGLLVDRLLGVRDLGADELHLPPSTVAAEPAHYLDGVATVGEPPRPLLVLAPERLLHSEQLAEFRREAR